MSFTLVLLASAVCVQATAACYWNAECPYQLYSAKTPYDTIRGDIRDHPVPQNCEAVTIWVLCRHGNRYPDYVTTNKMMHIASLKDEIVASYEAGSSQLCAQDIENFRRWAWNETLEVSQYLLTDTGYDENYKIGKRLWEKYPHLLQGSNDDYYFRTTDDQLSNTSLLSFIHGLTEDTNLTLTPDEARTTDDVIRPFKTCDRYQKTVLNSQDIQDQIDAHLTSAEHIAVHNTVQQRLGIATQLTQENMQTLYDLCRFERSWSEVHQSPWCAAFSDQDLIVLEYIEDIRHYYKNGYGSWVNVKLGGIILKDLYENIEISVSGHGKKIISYITEVSTIEMSHCAMGNFKDANQIQGSYRDPNRMWRTSLNSGFSVNIIAVLNRCEESAGQSYRVQLFVNERETELCPLEGCTWQQFQEKFQGFKSANLDFCSMN